MIVAKILQTIVEAQDLKNVSLNLFTESKLKFNKIKNKELNMCILGNSFMIRK